MNLYFRLLLLLLKSAFKEKVGKDDVVETTLRVLPTDIDFNRHMNNARYLSAMDLGRIDYMMRTGLLKASIKRKWAPIVANIEIQFMKSLLPWEQYTLQTRLDSYDEKYAYLEQTFIRKDGTVAARAVVKGLFLSKQGKVTPTEVLEVIDDVQNKRP